MWSAVVLAAGKGTRMGSDTPKVLHELGGRPLVAYPLEAAWRSGVECIVVVTGYAEERVRHAVGQLDLPIDIRFAHQAEQLGTGHAVDSARPEIPREGPTLVLSGDVPLIRAQSLVALRDASVASRPGLSLATFEAEDPTGYGRIVRGSDGRVLRIREQKDASPAERSITECNAGTYCIEAAWMHEHLPTIGTDNAQREMYLTDLVELAAQQGEAVAVSIAPIEAAGVNTPAQLAMLESRLDGAVPS